MRRVLVQVIALLQAALGFRVARRLIRTAGGARIAPVPESTDCNQRITVLVPVLNEAQRLGPCLDGLIDQDKAVSDIIVIDGGSVDATVNVVEQYARRDQRIQLISAGPPPCGQNGKAWQLAAGLRAADSQSEWILTIDADVRAGSGLARALVSHAQNEGVAALSVATRQRLSGAAEGLVHPSMLATLVYRFGIPGHATICPQQVQANGQCFLTRRDALLAAGGFGHGLGAIAEDVAVARAIAAAGQPIGFYESDDLVHVAMYDNAIEAWRNWSRSLPLVDRHRPWPGVVGLAEVVLVQAIPPWIAVLSRGAGMPRRLNLVLTAMRIGVVAGTVRAYDAPPLTYWLSPVADLPIAITLVGQAMRRRHRWRGRLLEIA